MVLEKSEKASEMASLDEAADLLRQIAGNRRADESLKAVLRRVGRQLSDWSDSRIRAVWYRDRRTVVRAAEVEQLRAVAARRDRRKEDAGLQELRRRIARLEHLLAVSDEAFHRESIAALQRQRSEVG